MISLLPTALGQPVRRWAVGGISLGGHITSMALAEGICSTTCMWREGLLC